MSVKKSLPPTAAPILKVEKLADTKLTCLISPQHSVCILTDTDHEATQLLNELFLTGKANATYTTEAGQLHTPSENVRATQKNLCKWRQTNLSIWTENSALPKGLKVHDLLSRAHRKSSTPLSYSEYEQIISLLNLASLKSQQFKNLNEAAQTRVALGVALVKKLPCWLLQTPLRSFPTNKPMNWYSHCCVEQNKRAAPSSTQPLTLRSPATQAKLSFIPRADSTMYPRTQLANFRPSPRTCK